MEVISVFSLQSSVFRTDFPGEGEALPPYLASTLWMQGKADRKTLKTRDYTRTLIESNSPEGMVLTVPVVGGSSAAKRLKPEDLEVSDHGDWTRIHLGAIEAAYGREPYFQHFFPEIASVIAQYPQQLVGLNVLLMEKMISFIGYPDAIEDIRNLRKANPERCEAIYRRMEAKVNPDHSFIEPLFRLGPDAIFLL
ncbi:MAG: WbqC family protein [Muribaculaceae bacterium]|nr:WbqC family protein [Muribaculaceae bacterium]